MNYLLSDGSFSFQKVCDGSGTVSKCDTLCGGAGCGKCGGLSCDMGAVTRAENAFELAKDAENVTREKEGVSKQLLGEVSLKCSICYGLVAFNKETKHILSLTV